MPAPMSAQRECRVRPLRENKVLDFLETSDLSHAMAKKRATLSR
jgi:hypothetical protein